ncbi:hypothetical protein [Massilia sp. YIM B04103]|uniref:hypothetical protein n=1 Tax=Massilia sp. YIM B04103 TaxID=2963106 RepID=UPI00210D4B6C|nr:hypothetical protein [Massilia sp. YIM B04103]
MALTGQRVMAMHYVTMCRRKLRQHPFIGAGVAGAEVPLPRIEAGGRGGAFNVLVAAATAFDAARGPELALTGWSLAHGLANLVIDEALTDLPIKVPAPSVLARAMAARMLGLHVGVD